MARARNIKPGFFLNEKLAESPPLTRLLFQGLWCHADREGRLENRPKRLKAAILPYDECDVIKMLSDLESKGFLIVYGSNNSEFIQIVNFTKHQNPNIKEAASTIPAPNKHSADTVPTLPLSPSLKPLPPSPKPMTDVVTPSTRVLDAMGVRNDPNWHGDGGRVRAWINDGADLELDILPTIKRIMEKRNGQEPPRSLTYFDQAIADAKATRLNPLPQGTPRGNGNGHATGPITTLHRAGEKVLAVREERRRREAQVSGDIAKPLLVSK